MAQGKARSRDEENMALARNHGLGRNAKGKR